MADKITTNASGGRAVKLPTIPLVKTGDKSVDNFAAAVKEYIEVREGIRAGANERVVLKRDLIAAAETATEVTPTQTAATASTTGVTALAVTKAVDSAKTILRAELAATERSIYANLSEQIKSYGYGPTTEEALGMAGGATYTTADLIYDLSVGAVNVVAGAASGDTIMELGTDGSYVVFKHRYANLFGSTGAYSGAYRTALGLTSTGIVGGYNRQSDGAWQTTLAIESATGNLTVLGTIRANSVIEVGAYLGASTVSTVVSNAADGAAALAGLSDKLDAQSTYILGTDFTLKTPNFDTSAGVAITDTGILGKDSTGTTFAIDTNGNATFKGTVSAGTLISDSALLGGTAVSTVVSNAADGASALSQVSSKLDAGSSYTLTGAVNVQNTGGIQAGSVTWDSTTGVVTGGTGVVLTENGITGVQSGVTTFAIDNLGNATFKGDITGASGSFAGSISTAGSIYTSNYMAAVGTSYVAGTYTLASNGNSYSIGGSVYGTTGATGTAGQVRAGIFGRIGGATNSNGYNIGVIGMASTSYQNSFGVYGEGGVGGYFASSNTTPALIGTNSGSGPSLYCATSMLWGNYTYSAPNGSTTNFLRADGTWAPASGSGGVTSVSGTGTVSGITLSGTVTSSGSLTLGGSLSLTAANLTATAPGTAYYLSGQGWLSTNPIMTTASTNSGSAVVSGNVLNMRGSTSTGIAGAYVGTSGSGNTVTWTIQTTSPSDRRLKEDIQDCELGLDFVNSLKPKSYKLVNDPRHQVGYGFIADEVADLGVYDSSLVYREENWQVGDVTGFDTIHYPSYVAVLTKAIQELTARVAQLEAANGA